MTQYKILFTQYTVVATFLGTQYTMVATIRFTPYPSTGVHTILFPPFMCTFCAQSCSRHFCARLVQTLAPYKATPRGQFRSPGLFKPGLFCSLLGLFYPLAPYKATPRGQFCSPVLFTLIPPNCQMCICGTYVVHFDPAQLPRKQYIHIMNISLLCIYRKQRIRTMYTDTLTLSLTLSPTHHTHPHTPTHTHT